MVSQTYDPRDPVQRATMDRLYPELSQSKRDLWQRFQEQQNFIVQMSIAPPGAGGAASHERLVRILGGAEQIIVHDLVKHLYGVDDQEYAALSSLANSVFGLFTAFKRAEIGPGDGARAAQMQSTRPVRIRVGYQVGHHFPRFFEGRLSWQGAGGHQRPFGLLDGDAVERLVLMCESVVNQDRLLQYVIGRMGVAGDNPALPQVELDIGDIAANAQAGPQMF